MARPQRLELVKQLYRRLGFRARSRATGGKSTYRRNLLAEALEVRALLATIVWGNVNGGAWGTASNWVGGVVPGANDDAVIPDLPGAPTITFASGGANVRSLSLAETLHISGGNFIGGTITPNGAGNVRLSGGALLNSTVSTGPINLTANAQLSNVTVGVGARLSVPASVTATIPNGTVLTVNGTATLGMGATLALVQTSSSGSPAQVVVNGGGELSASGAVISATGFAASRTLIDVKDNGRLRASNTTIGVSVFYAQASLFNAGDWSGNRMDALLSVPARIVPFLSAASGGANNARFGTINVMGAVTSGTLDLRLIGTETTANLLYNFVGNFTIANGATLNVLPAVRVGTENATVITVAGAANFADGSSINLFQSSSSQATTQLIIANQGVINFTGASITTSGFAFSRTFIDVQGGGRLIASNSTFSVSAIYYASAAIFNAGDLTNNRVDSALYLPHQFVRFLSAAGGGASNARFADIYIHSGTLATGTLDLRLIGTESTANLYYNFNGNFTIANGATLNVASNVRVWTANASVITVSGTTNFNDGSSLTFLQTSSSQTASQLVVTNLGVANFISSTVGASGFSASRTFIDVRDGGRMTANNSLFTGSTIYLANNVVFNPGDWSSNRFDSSIFVPHRIIPLLSAIDGGADNLRFNDIYINAGSLSTGALNLRAIGSETTANLDFTFAGDFNFAIGTTLNVFPGVRTWIDQAVVVTISGTANFQAGSSLTFIQGSTFGTPAQLVVNANAVLNTTGASFHRTGFASNRTLLDIRTGATLNSTNSSFAPGSLVIASGANATFDQTSNQTIATGNPTQVLTNYKSIDLSYGSTLNLGQPLQVGSSASDTASVKLSYSSTLAISGNLTGRTRTPANYLPAGRVLMNLGNVNTPQLLEVMSADVGAVSSGYVNNFAYGKLELAPNTLVRLVNADSNWSDSRPEALYVNTLIIPAGARLDLNGQKLYVRAAQILGTLVDGNTAVQPVFVPDGGPLQFAVPTPGHIAAAETDEWTFTAPTNEAVSIQVNPGSSGITAAVPQVLRRVRIELLSANNTLLKTVENDADGNIVTLFSDSLTVGASYKIRVRAHSGFSALTGNYVITLLQAKDSESALSISVNPGSLSQLEGNSGSVSYAYTVTRSGDLTVPVTVSWAVTGVGTYPANANDFVGGVLPSGTLSFSSPTELSKTITINVASDTNYENDETFAVTLSNPSSLTTMVVASVTSTIVNDDVPQNPDLQVTAISPPTAAVTGQTVTLGWTETNTGAVTASGTWNTLVRVVNTTTGQIVFNQFVFFNNNALVPQAAVNRSVQFALPDGTLGVGQYEITITVDGTNQVAEANPFDTGESNNSRTSDFAVTLANYPDLAAMEATLPGSVQFSVPFEISYRVENVGNAAQSRTVRDRIYLSTDGQVDLMDRILATYDVTAKLPLAAGDSYTHTVSVTLPLEVALQPGSYQILIVTDALNEQFELNDANNLLARPISVALPPLPDLIVESIRTRPLVVAGQSVEVTWVVKNQGTGPADGDWSDRVWLSADDQIGNDLFLRDFPVTTTIPPGGSIERTQLIDIPTGLTGNYRLVIRTDATLRINEYDKEDNNTSIDDQVIVIDPTPSPNLILDSVSSLTSNLFTGQAATIEWVVRNIGNASSGSEQWVDRVYLSADPHLSADDRALGQVANPSFLAVGNNYRSSLTVTLPEDAPGKYHFIVVTDANNRVPEIGREDDNTRAGSEVTIQLTPPPDLVVTAVTSARDAFEGEPMFVGWTVMNQGTGPTRVNSWTDQIYLSFNGQDIDAADILLDSVTRNGTLAVDGQYQVSGHSVTLPANLVSDEAYIIVRTDAGRTVYEHSFEGNNDTAAEFPTRIRFRPRPDLRVDSITVPPMAAAGQSLRISYSVSNASLTATRESVWQDSIYLSTDPVLNPQSDLLLGHRQRTGILAGEQSETRSYDFVLASQLTGTYYVIVVSDSNDQVVEFDDENNVATSTNTVRVVIDPPDLRVTQVIPSSNLSAGREFSVTYTVTNSGGNPTPNQFWYDTIYLSTDDRWDASDRVLSDRMRTGVLPAGASESRTVNLRLPEDYVGNGYILVRTDRYDHVFEANEQNNLSAIQVQLADQRPDLTPASFVPRLPGSEVLPGSIITIDFAVSNTGLGPTFGNQWFDRLWLSPDTIVGNSGDVLLGSWTNVQQLAVGQSYQRLNLSVLVPTSVPDGQYRLLFETDGRRDVGETNESNNQAFSDLLTITRTPGSLPTPDLTPTVLTVPSSVTSGSKLPISWTVRNNGAATAANAFWYDTLWLSTDNVLDSNDIRIGQALRVDPLGANQQYTRTFDWPIDIDRAGNYFIIVQTDTTNQVIEGTAENNNVRASTAPVAIALGPTADLQVSSITAPVTAIAGRSLPLTWTVNNTGGGAATGPWIDRAFLSLDQIYDPATDVPLGFTERPTNLAVGQSYTASANYTIPAGLSGNYYVLVLTDSTGRVYERNGEGNNLRITTSPVQVSPLPPADLVVGNITIPSNTQLNQPATISFTITNNGQNSARGGWYDAIYLSTDDQWDIDDGYFGRVWRNVDVAAGGSYTQTLTAPLPGVLPGNYRVIIRSDIRNQVLESNEENNLGASLNSFVTDVPALTLGVPQTGTLAVGNSLYYKVNVPAGETVAIEVDAGSTAGAIELYSSFETMPRRSQAELTALEPHQTRQRILISSTQPGTYYILVHAHSLSSATSPFTIGARIVPFTVFEEGFGQGGTAGDRTLEINGARFDRSVVVELVDEQGHATPAVRYWRASETRLYATFDLRAQPRGTYSVRVHKVSSSESITIGSSLQVVYATVVSQPISLTRPDSFNRRRDDRPPAPIPVSLGWRNTTLNDIPVPLIHFSATDPFAATLAEAKSGATVSSLEFLGFAQGDGPRDILMPGQYGTAEFYVQPRAVAIETPPIDIHYVAEAIYEDRLAQYVWDFDLSQLDLSYLGDVDARAMIAAFRSSVDSNVGAFRQALTESLRRAGQGGTTNLAAASRELLQDIFDRFVAARMTSVSGHVQINSLATNYLDLVVTLTSTTGGSSHSVRVWSDGSFVLPHLTAGLYNVRVTGGSVKAAEGLQVSVTANAHVQLTIPLQPALKSTAEPVAPRLPTGLAQLTAPQLTLPGKINQQLSGNVLEQLLPQLSGINYRVELIGDAPAGFVLESNGEYRYLSNQITAFVVHYDLVLPDAGSRAGQLFNGEIRSRGSLAITLKNNFTRDVRSLDPNDIIGPAGYGDLKWVTASERLPYKIRFENDPKQASSPAQLVQIVQQLDSDLDPTSVEFGSFGFGGREFQVPAKRQSLNFDLDLRAELGIFVRVFAFVDAASGELSWTFSSISPTTGTDTTDPEDGFLPLNLLPPQGDGFVTYSVRAKRSAATGTTINARARIIFDGNSPIDTPEIFNTLDVNAPASRIVTTQAQTASSNLLVAWDGDDEPGAGVAAFNVYVAENGGSYRLWLADTTLLESEFVSTPGFTYEFTTVARDHVGNVEPDLKLPDASRPSALAGGPYTLVEGVSQNLSGVASDPDKVITSFAYEWDFNYDGITFDVDATGAAPALLIANGPATRVIAMRARGTHANAIYSLISTAMVTVQNAAPVVSASNSTLNGFVNGWLTNSGTWSDSGNDPVTLTASHGTVVKQSDGTWTWSWIPSSPQSNVAVVITATDDQGANQSTTFRVTAIVNTETFQPQLRGTTPAATNQQQLAVTIDFGQAVRGFTAAQLQTVNATVLQLNDLGDGQFEVLVRATTLGVVALTIPSGSSTDSNGRTNSELTVQWTYVDTSNMDFGDAPTAAQSGLPTSYPTRLAQNGARHRIGSLRLGAQVDAESDGQSAVLALGDDASGSDDEDGITFDFVLLASATSSTISSLTATASAAGKLDAWIDFNQDGDWDDLGEQIAASYQLVPGSNRLSFVIPAGAQSGTTYARFRISSTGGLHPTGAAEDGEVEDYAVTIASDSNVDLNIPHALGTHQLLVVNDQLLVRTGAATWFRARSTALASVRYLAASGTGHVYSFASPATNLFGQLSYDATSGVNISSEVVALNLSAMAGQLSGLDTIQLVSSASQTLSFTPADVSLISRSGRLSLITGRNDLLAIGNTWRYQATQQVAGQLIHQFQSGSVSIDVDGWWDWHNPINGLDVNGDGAVVPLDALLVINQINMTTGTPGGLRLPAFNPSRPRDFFFADVNGNGTLEPLDVLLIINHINTRGSGEGEVARVEADGPTNSARVDAAIAAVDLWDVEDRQRADRQRLERQRQALTAGFRSTL